MDGLARKIKRIVRHGESREPEFAVDLLAVGGKAREKVKLPSLGLDLRHRFPLRFHDLQVAVVPPDCPLKILAALDKLLGTDAEYVGCNLIHLDVAQVLDFIFR